MGKTFGELNIGDQLICLERDKLDHFKYYNLEIINNCKAYKWVKLKDIRDEHYYIFFYYDNNDLIQEKRNIDLQKLNELTGEFTKDNFYSTEYIFETLDECKSFVLNMCKDRITNYLKTIIEVNKW